MATKRICPVQDCGKRVVARGYCEKHWHRFMRFGDPNIIGRTEAGATTRFIQELLSRNTDECIKWPFFISENPGYGTATWNGRRMGHHRAVCLAKHGPAPFKKADAAHACGSKWCANPKHISWRTRSDNIWDNARHGVMPLGETHKRSKLTEAQVLEIYSLKGERSSAELAVDYGVHPRNIRMIHSGKTWSWLTGESQWPPHAG